MPGRSGRRQGQVPRSQVSGLSAVRHSKGGGGPVQSYALLRVLRQGGITVGIDSGKRRARASHDVSP